MIKRSCLKASTGNFTVNTLTLMPDHSRWTKTTCLGNRSSEEARGLNESCSTAFKMTPRTCPRSLIVQGTLCDQWHIEIKTWLTLARSSQATKEKRGDKGTIQTIIGMRHVLWSTINRLPSGKSKPSPCAVLIFTRRDRLKPAQNLRFVPEKWEGLKKNTTTVMVTKRNTRQIIYEGKSRAAINIGKEKWLDHKWI